MKKVLGLGNAIVDVLTFIEDDSLLAKLNIPKGSMQLIDDQGIENISDKLVEYQRYMVTGGSAANAISGIACLGLRGGFIGKIGMDEVGEFFKNDFMANGIRPYLKYSESLSGQCLVLVSEDGERTMCTYLGAASEMMPHDIDPDCFDGYDYLHIEGYLVFNRDLLSHALAIAKSKGIWVSLDLASFNIVEANLEYLKSILDEYVDIVFANEEEAKAFAQGASPEEALHVLAEYCETAVVKLGKHGSMAKHKGEIYTYANIPAVCIDTTGAGDLYASGFIYGLAEGLDLQKCGDIASLVAGHVVEVVGAKMDDDRWKEINEKVKAIATK